MKTMDMRLSLEGTLYRLVLLSHIIFRGDSAGRTVTVTGTLGHSGHEGVFIYLLCSIQQLLASMISPSTTSKYLNMAEYQNAVVELPRSL